MVLSQAINNEIDDLVSEKAQALLDTVPQVLEDALSGSPYLMGDEISAADLTLVPFLRFTVWKAETVEHPLAKFVTERLQLHAKFPKTRAWIERVMELDREPVAH